MVTHIRWCFNVSRWKPSREDWLKLTSCIDLHEVERCNRYVYQEDCKASMIGRAMIRKFVSIALDRPSNELRLTRNNHGRPEIAEEYKSELGSAYPKVFDFNLSHSGDYCVLVGIKASDIEISFDSAVSVGVDITKIVSKQSKTELDRFLSLMQRREFTKKEWTTVEQASTDRQKCINFTRLWCLKESFIKAIGLGLAFKLSRIDFECDTSTHLGDVQKLRHSVIRSTTVLLDGRPANNWSFAETSIDSEHLVAIAYGCGDCDKKGLLTEGAFDEISIDTLLTNLSPISDQEESNWVRYSSKSNKFKS